MLSLAQAEQLNTKIKIVEAVNFSADASQNVSY
jgi:hypothetical protein